MIKKRAWILTLAGICIALVLGAQVTATETPKVTVKIGTDIIDGDTMYRIGYPIHTNGQKYYGYFPISQLEWPLDVTMGRVEATAAFSQGIKVNMVLKKNITDPDNHEKDSDWLTPSNPDKLDVYSESSISSFDGMIVDINTTFDFLKKKKFKFLGGIGFQFQRFEYEAKFISQYSPSGLTGWDGTGDGRVALKYDINYYMPYLKFGGIFRANDKFTVKGSLGYSPYTWATDEDHHLIREYGGKISKADMDGYSYMLDLSATYNLTSAWFIEAGLNLTKIEMDGTSDEYFAWYGKVSSYKEESESNQTSGYISIGTHF